VGSLAGQAPTRKNGVAPPAFLTSISPLTAMAPMRHGGYRSIQLEKSVVANPTFRWTLAIVLRFSSRLWGRRLLGAASMEIGRRLVLALDRPIPCWEAVGMPRTIDHDVTIVRLDLDAEGKGEGRMA